MIIITDSNYIAKHVIQYTYYMLTYIVGGGKIQFEVKTMELLQLKYFADASKTENFSVTARNFYVPPSAVSQTIKKLEKEVGVKLFDRKGNRVVLNENGRIMSKGIIDALGLLDSSLKKVKDREHKVAGEIRLLVLTNRRIVTSCIARFRQKHPEVQFTLCHDFSMSDFGAFDLCIGELPKNTGGMITELLIREEVMLAMPDHHPMTQKEKIFLTDLRRERFIVLPKGSSLYQLTIKTCRTGGFEPEIAIQCDDPYYIRRYVGLGLGITLVPTFSWQGMEHVTLREIDDISLKRDTYLYRDASRFLPYAAEQFWKELKTLCREETGCE